MARTKQTVGKGKGGKTPVRGAPSSSPPPTRGEPSSSSSTPRARGEPSAPTPPTRGEPSASSSTPRARGEPPAPTPPTRGEPADLRLTIEYPPHTFTIAFSPLQQVQDLRAKVAAKLSFPIDDTELRTQDGRVLLNEKTLEFYDLPQDARILPKKKVAGEISVDDAIASLAEMKGKCKGVDVCFAFDTTGSMNGVICEVRKQVRDTCRRLMGDISGIRISIMGVGDFCDQMSTYVVHTLDFCDDPGEIESFVRSVGGTYGGDSPECYEWALHKANLLSWRDEPGIAKAFVLIADALPHPPSYSSAHCSWQDELGILADRGVKVYAVQASASSNVVPFYARLAERSGGLHLTFKSFDLITRMFLAVCYREAGRLSEYESEGRRGVRGAEMGEILDTMAKPNEKVAQQSKIVCSEIWFKETVTQAKGKKPTYFYDPTRDMFFSFSMEKYGDRVDKDKFSLGMEKAIDEQFLVRSWSNLLTARDKVGTTPTVAFPMWKPKKTVPASPRTPKKKAAAPKPRTPPPRAPSSSAATSSKRKRVASEGAVGAAKKKAKKTEKVGDWEKVPPHLMTPGREERLRRRKEREEKGEAPKRLYYWHY